MNILLEYPLKKKNIYISQVYCYFLNLIHMREGGFLHAHGLVPVLLNGPYVQNAGVNGDIRAEGG